MWWHTLVVYGEKIPDWISLGDPVSKKTPKDSDILPFS